MPKKIVFISCVSKKLSSTAKARDMYISTLFKLNLMYAEKLNPDEIFILSAKYGLVSLEQEIDPYEQTLNNMGVLEVKSWAGAVLNQIKESCTIDETEFTFLAGDKYRKYLLPHLGNVKIPLEGLRIGEQLQKLKGLTSMSDECTSIHELTQALERHRFPFEENKIPTNGIYILFEAGETGHEQERIVRIGTHTGENQLRSRLKQHFVDENKDRSIFRKNIGRALLSKKNDPFLEYWELDLTTREAKEKYSPLIDFSYQQEIEGQVSKYIKERFSFCVFEVNSKEERLECEAKIISTVSWCEKCKPSENWLGNNSPKEKIVKSGLWLVNELYKTPFKQEEIVGLSVLMND